MKLVRDGHAGPEKPGLIDEDGVVRDQSRVAKDITAELLSLCLRSDPALKEPY